MVAMHGSVMPNKGVQAYIMPYFVNLLEYIGGIDNKVSV